MAYVLWLTLATHPLLAKHLVCAEKGKRCLNHSPYFEGTQSGEGLEKQHRLKVSCEVTHLMMEFTVGVTGTLRAGGPSLLGVVRGQTSRKERQQAWASTE